MNKVFVGLGVVAVGIGGWLWYYRNQENNKEKMTMVQSVVESQKQKEAPELSTETVVQPEARVRQEEVIESRDDSLETPFIVQAPNGEWDNPLFENACEEASMLMVAKLFDRVMSVSPDEARRELLAIATYEKKVFGHAFDTSATDTARILREYFEIENGVIEPKTEADLRELLQEENILIVPTDGQRLGNPFFKTPGPDTHMLVVLAYDDQTGEYVVHDPGTKRGEQYHYKSEVLWDAIRDYPTAATHLPNTKKERRVIGVSLEK